MNEKNGISGHVKVSRLSESGRIQIAKAYYRVHNKVL